MRHDTTLLGAPRNWKDFLGIQDISAASMNALQTSGAAYNYPHRCPNL